MSVIRTGELKKHYNVVGIGAGPSNLSLAALGTKTDIDLICLDRRNNFAWHSDMLLEQSMLQVHYLKDCVSLVDPTNPYSFLNYLATHNRIYQFMNKKTEVISRCEFSRYFQWVSDELNNVRYGCGVDSVSYENNCFNLKTSLGDITADHLVCATGRVPNVPENFKHLLGPNIYHNTEYLRRKKDYTNKRIAVIGGGQSGAEIVFDQLKNENILPKNITWVSKRLNFHPLEDSCFSNEFYTPSYIKYFHGLSYHTKQRLLAEQVLTSDGITQELIDNIYNRLYDLKFLHASSTILYTLVKQELSEIKTTEQGYQLVLYENILNKTNTVEVDTIIFATGYKEYIPTCLNNIKDLFQYLDDGRLDINYDYSIKMLHALPNKIFVQNGSRHTHGVADPNLSLMPWRSAQILNSLLGYEFYPECTSQPILSMIKSSSTTHKVGVELQKETV